MVQSNTPVSPDALLKAAERLPPRQFDRFVNKVLSLRASRRAPCLSEKETRLMLKISRGLPEAQRRRYRVLIAKRRAGTLTPGEHAEILRLGDNVEKREVQRLEAIVELAEMRHVSVDELMRELGIKAPPYE